MVRSAFGRFGRFGFDFVGGGVAGAGEGAPHVPAGDGAVGAPAFAEGEEFFGAGLVFFAVGDGPAFLYAEVVNGKDVGAAEAEDQEHFDGPGSDAADGDKAFYEFLIGEFFGLFEGRDDSFDGFLREVFHGEDFCAGEPGFPESLGTELQHFLRCGETASFTEGFDAAEDSGGGFAGNGLVGDGFEKCFVGRLMGVHFGVEGRGGADEFCDGFVASGEMFCGGVEVEGKGGRLVDHGAEPAKGSQDTPKPPISEEKTNMGATEDLRGTRFARMRRFKRRKQTAALVWEP